MATNYSHQSIGTRDQIVLADHAGGFNASGDDIRLPGASYNNVQAAINNLASQGAGQSDKFSVVDGSGFRPPALEVSALFEFTAAPASGGVLDLYLAWSHQTPAGTGNAGGMSGVAGSYTGTPGDTIANAALQLTFIGQMIVTQDAGIQISDLGIVPVLKNNASLMVYNRASAAFVASALNTCVVLTPVVDGVEVP